jgi:hypothetical protein
VPVLESPDPLPEASLPEAPPAAEPPELPDAEPAPVSVTVEPESALLPEDESLPASPDEPLVPAAPVCDVASEPLLDDELPELPPVPVAFEDDDPESPVLALLPEFELAPPEFPPVDAPPTSPELPVCTWTATPPVPPPSPPPVPPLLPSAPPVVPLVPSLLAPPPSPDPASALPPDVASPVSPLDEPDVVVVSVEPLEELDLDLDLDLAVPLIGSAGASTVRTTLPEAAWVDGSSISAVAIAATNAIFSSMALVRFFSENV